MPEESEIKSCEDQDNADVCCQPFPKSVSEEQEVHGNYDHYHDHNIKRGGYLSAHCNKASIPGWIYHGPITGTSAIFKV